MNEKDVMIGVDGSVYGFHPFYHNLLMGKISELVNSGIKFGLILSQDGSGRGAAACLSISGLSRRIIWSITFFYYIQII